MIKGFIKYTLFFVVSYFILSINISKKPLFYHLNTITGPMGDELSMTLGKGIKRSISNSKKYGNKFFDSTPNKTEKVKKIFKASGDSHIQEELKHSDQVQLDQVINK